MWTKKGTSSGKELISRLMRWRINPTWYAVVLFTAPTLATLVLLFNYMLGFETTEWAILGSWAEL
ncbi:hypothetical protein [Fodinibius salinus]|uniref:hypothetical protein n=1 Tax=Fodinibius salinus TaxID=860790 RepID=UPI0011E685F5|nr:hypothetical protein [Fodinibius salinus]